MKIIVPIKFVPDLVEELKIDKTGVNLDPDWLHLKLNEFDDHAIEQAILLKERGLGSVIVIALDAEGVEDVLYTASAKGANRVIRISGKFDKIVNSHTLARILAHILQELQPDLVLTGVQAHNDLDGSVGPLLAEYLGFPYVGYIVGIDVNDTVATIRKGFPGGLIAEMEVTLPAVLGIQTANQPPRDMTFSKIRQAMNTTNIEELRFNEPDNSGGPTIRRMFQLENSKKAEMISGDVDEVSRRLVRILVELGVI